MSWSTMMTLSQTLEFILSYGIHLHCISTIFSTHDILYLTTQQCLLRLATRPKAWNGLVPMIVYRLTRRREGWLLHISTLHRSPSNTCQVKSVFESVKPSMFGIVSVSYFPTNYTLTTNMSLQSRGMDIVRGSLLIVVMICYRFSPDTGNDMLGVLSW
jgi:hypothetical protein